MFNKKQAVKKFILNNKVSVFILFLLPIINVIFNSYFCSKYMGRIIKYITENNRQETIYNLKYILVFIIGLQVLRYIQRKVLTRFLEKINHSIKKASFEIFTNLSVEEARKNSEYVNRFGDEVVETINLVYSFLYRPFCSLVVVIIGMMFANRLLGKIFLLFAIIFFTFLKFIVRKPMFYITQLEKQQAHNRNFINDISRNSFLEKILNLKTFTSGLFSKKLQDENTIFIKKYDSIATNGLYGNLICQIFHCIMLIVIILSSLPIDLKITYINLVFGFFCEFNDVPILIVPLLNNIGKIKENMKIMNVPIEEAKEIFNEDINKITIKNISFGYNNVNIINNFSTELKKGVYKIQGKSGNGKSTLLQLIMGLKKINNGEILINNNHISDKNILNRVSYLSQFDYTYNRTVKDNLSMNKDLISIERDIAAYKMESILNNNVGINGENISGGQSKRLCFLRMLNFHKKGNLIILDEPFNGLDEDLINLIINFINENISSSIILVIDHTNSVSSGIYNSIVLGN